MDVAIGHVVTQLLSETDIGQFDDTLYGCEILCGSHEEEILLDAENDEDDVNEEILEKCLACGKSCLCANALMEIHVNKCKSAMKNSPKACSQFLRDPMITSLNLDDYLLQDVYSWQPEKMITNSRSLVCWDSTCFGQKGKESMSILFMNLNTNFISLFRLM